MKRYRHPLLLWLGITIHVITFAASIAAEPPIDYHVPAISQSFDLINLSRPEVMLRTGLFDWLGDLTNSPSNLKNVVESISGSALKNHPKITACCRQYGEDDFLFFPSRFIHNCSLRL